MLVAGGVRQQQQFFTTRFFHPSTSRRGLLQLLAVVARLSLFLLARLFSNLHKGCSSGSTNVSSKEALSNATKANAGNASQLRNVRTPTGSWAC